MKKGYISMKSTNSIINNNNIIILYVRWGYERGTNAPNRYEGPILSVRTVRWWVRTKYSHDHSNLQLPFGGSYRSVRNDNEQVEARPCTS